ncbi:hypothetical protein DLAC_03186 [Tieghemostelium lacteum]|uniref:RING-type domain-containing protein n=1 Tax=Tieghemostelium lacteum TaxID=361077 RepID=A0A152A2J9_TIELA|nr:hypothetical protein DLAC_03186 [Tieghemostelium lacteum]|eukprot:KYR00430.1 hypothetical protein DLAC_03186 [Tieghemostelium lacteum]
MTYSNKERIIENDKFNDREFKNLYRLVLMEQFMVVDSMPYFKFRDPRYSEDLEVYDWNEGDYIQSTNFIVGLNSGKLVRVKIEHFPLLLKGIRNYEEMDMIKNHVVKGKWMYEIIASRSNLTLGWDMFSTVEEITGNRLPKQFQLVERFMIELKISNPLGNIFGCSIDTWKETIKFTEDGEIIGELSLTEKLKNLKGKNVFFMPAISFENSYCSPNLGSLPFRYPKNGYKPLVDRDPYTDRCRYLCDLYKSMVLMSVNQQDVKIRDDTYFDVLCDFYQTLSPYTIAEILVPCLHGLSDRELIYFIMGLRQHLGWKNVTSVFRHILQRLAFECRPSNDFVLKSLELTQRILNIPVMVKVLVQFSQTSTHQATPGNYYILDYIFARYSANIIGHGHIDQDYQRSSIQYKIIVNLLTSSKESETMVISYINRIIAFETSAEVKKLIGELVEPPYPFQFLFNLFGLLSQVIEVYLRKPLKYPIHFFINETFNETQRGRVGGVFTHLVKSVPMGAIEVNEGQQEQTLAELLMDKLVMLGDIGISKQLKQISPFLLQYTFEQILVHAGPEINVLIQFLAVNSIRMNQKTLEISTPARTYEYLWNLFEFLTKMFDHFLQLDTNIIKYLYDSYVTLWLFIFQFLSTDEKLLLSIQNIDITKIFLRVLLKINNGLITDRELSYIASMTIIYIINNTKILSKMLVENLDWLEGVFDKLEGDYPIVMNLCQTYIDNVSIREKIKSIIVNQPSRLLQLVNLVFRGIADDSKRGLTIRIKIANYLCQHFSDQIKRDETLLLVMNRHFIYIFSKVLMFLEKNDVGASISSGKDINVPIYCGIIYQLIPSLFHLTNCDSSSGGDDKVLQTMIIEIQLDNIILVLEKLSKIPLNKFRLFDLDSFMSMHPDEMVTSLLNPQLTDIPFCPEITALINYFKVLSTNQTLKQINNQDNQNIETQQQDPLCTICYTYSADTVILPCNHESCHHCISLHLLSNNFCFFCRQVVESHHIVKNKNLIN